MIPVVPGATSVKFHLLINDTTGTFLMGNWTASGATLAYNIGESGTWTKVTIGQGTEGTWSSGTIVDSATSSTSPVLGYIQVCVPDASVPSALGQRVAFKLDNGTASGSRAMFPLPFTLVGSNVNAAAMDTNSHYLVNVVAMNYSTAAAATLSLVTNDSNSNLKVSPQLNGIALLSQPDTAGTMTLCLTLTTYTGNTPQTGDAFARIGTAGVGLTNLGDTRIAHLDADVTSRMATYVQPTGFLAATFPSGTIASTTNITAGTIATVTTLTNLPAITANWLTAAGIAASALNGKGDWLLSSGYTVPPTVSAIRIEMDTNSTKLDVATGTRLASASYTAPDNSGIASAASNAATAATNANTAANQASNAAAATTALGLIITTLFDGITSMRNWLRAALRNSTADATALLEINGTSSDYSPSRDSLSAIGRGGTLLATGWTISANKIVWTAANLANAPSGGGGSGLTGPNPITVTFLDANLDPVPLVQFTVVGQGPGRAGSDGIATFGLPTETSTGYTLTAQITGGVLFPSTDFTVSGTTAVTVTGTGITIPAPSAPNCITGFLYSKTNGVLTPGLVMHYQQVGPIDGPGYGYDEVETNVTSDANSVWAITDLEPGGRYTFWITSTRKVTYTIPLGTSTPYLLPFNLV